MAYGRREPHRQVAKNSARHSPGTTASADVGAAQVGMGRQFAPFFGCFVVRGRGGCRDVVPADNPGVEVGSVIEHQVEHWIVAGQGKRPVDGTVKLTDLWTYSELCPLPKWLIPHADDDRIRLQNQRFPFNLTVPSGSSKSAQLSVFISVQSSIAFDSCCGKWRRGRRTHNVNWDPPAYSSYSPAPRSRRATLVAPQASLS